MMGLADACHKIDPTDKTNESKLDNGEKATDGKLSMNVVAEFNVKEPVGHVHFGPQIVNTSAAINEK